MMDKLKKEHIQPKPKWQFLLQSIFIGIGVVIFLIIGILAAAVVELFITDLHLLEIFEFGPVRGMKALFIGLPVFWLVVLGILGALTSVFMQRTETGHRHSLWWWFGAIIIIQIFGGIALAESNFGEHIERGMEHQIFQKHNIDQARDAFWNRADDGFLAGEIKRVNSTDIHIRTLDDTLWVIQTHAADIHPQVEIKVGNKARFVGEKLTDNEFKALKIVPWEHPRRGRKKGDRLSKPPRGGIPPKRENQPNLQLHHAELEKMRDEVLEEKNK